MRDWILAGLLVVSGASAVFLTIALLLRRSLYRRFLKAIATGAFEVSFRERTFIHETRAETDQLRGVADHRAFVLEAVTDARERTRFRLTYDNVPFRLRRIGAGERFRHPVSRAYWRLIREVRRPSETIAA